MTNTILTQGTLSNGTKWLYDGDDIYTYSAERDEWLVPCLDSLTEAERDELSAIGAEMNLLSRQAKACGDFFVDAIIANGELEKWAGLNWQAFSQAMANDNPPFTVTNGDGEPIDDGDGTLFGIAAKEAWEILQAYLEADKEL